jgi:beta-mannosidase
MSNLVFTPRTLFFFRRIASAVFVFWAGLVVCHSAVAQRASDVSTSRFEQTLDGTDWTLGSFAMGAGETAGAQNIDFDDHAFRRVEVPGEVQLQLGIKGQDLFRQSNEITSINRQEWWYRKHLKVQRPQHGKRVLLQFDGVDYFAGVWLNGKHLGDHEGTFVPFSFDVTDTLRYGADNVLAIRVTHPWVPKDRGFTEYMNGNFSMSVYSGTTTLSHPPYTFSANWDGLPAHGNAVFSMGLWRSVRLVTMNMLTFSDLYARTISIQPDGSALLEVGGTVENAGQFSSQLSVALDIAPANFAGPNLPPVSIPVNAVPGKTEFHTQVRVDKAQLWWTWDSGAQNLYRLTARVLSASKENAAIKAREATGGDTQSIRFGIRTVTRDADMTFRVNGKRIFIKASWFPIEDYFGSRSTWTSYDRDLRLFRDANLNLLVNFTVVEKPDFYDLCDELGILIVVEMPFPQFGPGNALAVNSPRRKPFLMEAQKEIELIVTALRSHPAIVEWAPIAESHDAGGAWGFDGVIFDQSGYQAFSDEMRSIVTHLAPGAIFHPSLCDLGEKHFWMATAGYRGDSGDYQQHFDASINFVSEYGGISMSSYEKLGSYLTAKEQWNPEDHAQPRWFGLPIDISAYSYLSSSEYDSLYSMLYRSEHYVDRDIRSPRDLVDDTQTYQAFLLKYATEAYRRKKYEPINGIRFWDFLEIGPGFRFGIVDLDRIPKVSYWWMKRAQSRLAVNFAYKNALESQVAGSNLSIPVWVINDLDHPVDATILCTVYDLHGNKVFGRSFNKEVPTDGKAEVGALDWILPAEAGVYVVRASVTSAHSEDKAEDTTFVKVVPRAFAHPIRVLLIGQSTSTTPIAEMLRGVGVKVDVRDEESVGRFDDLADGAALHAKYDVVWLATFENFAKVLDPAVANGIKDAVSAGTGFIHSGGEASYHGGNARQALIELTALADLLPVAIQNRDDLVFGEHTLDDTLQSEAGLRDIQASEGTSWPGLALLRHYGVEAFNQVSPRPGSHTLLTVHGEPLLVDGQFGKGHTVSFTGFTPSHARNNYLLGQQLIRDPGNRAFFETFIGLVALASGQQPVLSSEELLDANEKPLFQTLKEQPETKIDVSFDLVTGPRTLQVAGTRQIILKNGASYAHLVRLRMEWDPKGPQPYLTEFSDNAFEMLPGEEKTIVLSWRMVAPEQHPSGTLIVDGANATQVQVPLNPIENSR